MISKCGFGGLEFRLEGDDGKGGRKARDEMWFMLGAGTRVVHVEGEECWRTLYFYIYRMQGFLF